MLGVTHRVNPAIGADDADTEQLGRHASQRGVDVRNLPEGNRPEAQVRIIDQTCDTAGRRQITGGYETLCGINQRIEKIHHRPQSKPT